MNPFTALGLPARTDLDDEQVRQAGRTIAAATHPDRADGGDPTAYTAASAAYARLRPPSHRLGPQRGACRPGRPNPAGNVRSP
jgi:hypothetical protein